MTVSAPVEIPRINKENESNKKCTGYKETILENYNGYQICGEILNNISCRNLQIKTKMKFRFTSELQKLEGWILSTVG